MNAEKILKAEKSPALCVLLADAEYKYANDISLVCLMHCKYPGSDEVSRLAVADLWEVLMQRASLEGTPVFLVGGKPNVLAEIEQKLCSQWNVNLVDSQDGYFKPK